MKRIFVLLAWLLLLSNSLYAAISSTVVWEVQTGGDDNNGGGYKSDAATTDYSRQAAAQLTVTDAATSGTTVTTLTSATGGFTSAMVGNVLHLYSGTNLTAGWYEITGYTDTNTVTLDHAPDDGVGGVSGATCKVGGALGSPGAINTVPCVSGNIMWIKSGNYPLSTTTVGSLGPINLSLISASLILEGYETSRGDRGARPVIQAGTLASFTIVRSTSPGTSYQNAILNIDVDGGSGASVIGMSVGGKSMVIDCVVSNCSADGFGGDGTAVSCKAISCLRGFYVNAVDCYAKSCTQGYYYKSCNNCLADSCTYGFDTGYYTTLMNCTAYNSTTAGFQDTGTNTSLYNCVVVKSGGYSYNFSAASSMYNCADCTASGLTSASGRSNVAPIIDRNPITLTADPFVDSAGGDLRPNTDAGGGVLLRGISTGVYGQTDNRDIGAVQHADPASGGGILINPGQTGGIKQ